MIQIQIPPFSQEETDRSFQNKQKKKDTIEISKASGRLLEAAIDDDKMNACANSFITKRVVTAIFPAFNSSKSLYRVKSESTNISTNSNTAPLTVHTTMDTRIWKSILIAPLIHFACCHKHR